MESEPMLTPREKFPLLEKFSSEEDRTHDAASSRTVRATHYQWAIPALPPQKLGMKRWNVDSHPHSYLEVSSQPFQNMAATLGFFPSFKRNDKRTYTDLHLTCMEKNKEGHFSWTLYTLLALNSVHLYCLTWPPATGVGLVDTGVHHVLELLHCRQVGGRETGGEGAAQQVNRVATTIHQAAAHTRHTCHICIAHVRWPLSSHTCQHIPDNLYLLIPVSISQTTCIFSYLSVYPRWPVSFHTCQYIPDDLYLFIHVSISQMACTFSYMSVYPRWPVSFHTCQYIPDDLYLFIPVSISQMACIFHTCQYIPDDLYLFIPVSISQMTCIFSYPSVYPRPCC